MSPTETIRTYKLVTDDYVLGTKNRRPGSS